jgi:hypothetical protein
MPKKNAPSPQPQTHFELVPLEVVAKIAAIDAPFEVAPVLTLVQPSQPKPPPQTKK